MIGYIALVYQWG